MPTTDTFLGWASLTRAINEIKSPANFLSNLMFRNVETLPTETLELSVISGGREIAPFVRRDAEGILVGGYDEKFVTITMPNIRIKRAMQPSNLLYTRRPGSTIFITSQSQSSAMAQYIARETRRLFDLIANSHEYLASLALTGVITYSVTDEDVFTVTFPRDAGNTVTLSAPADWGNASAAAINIEQDFHNAKEQLADTVGLAPSICVMSQSSALNFMANEQVRTNIDRTGVNVGGITRQSQFAENGSIFLGRFSGIPCWEYNRSIDVNGTPTALIRDKFVEFICLQPAAEMIQYYGSIPDMDAIQARQFVGRIFSKSWIQKDPSVRMILAHSRPLPVTRRPDAIYSLKTNV